MHLIVCEGGWSGWKCLKLAALRFPRLALLRRIAHFIPGGGADDRPPKQRGRDVNGAEEQIQSPCRSGGENSWAG